MNLEQIKAQFGVPGFIYTVPAKDAEALPVEGYRIEMDGIFYACVASEVNIEGWTLVGQSE